MIIRKGSHQTHMHLIHTTLGIDRYWLLKVARESMIYFIVVSLFFCFLHHFLQLVLCKCREADNSSLHTLLLFLSGMQVCIVCVLSVLLWPKLQTRLCPRLSGGRRYIHTYYISSAGCCVVIALWFCSVKCMCSLTF